ncbi:MAG: Asp-tRNA(Asn)/Glu-tRNA(Gln) amidotransferase subunit GatA [Candidatus Falkowbacteria bacterium]
MQANKLTITEARALLDSGQLTAVQLTQDCLAAIEDQNDRLNACLEINSKQALAEAVAADRRLSEGERGGVLGIPYLAKDNILAKGFRATAASRMLADYQAPYDATVVSRLNAAGAILLGKTNLDEFAHGASTETSCYGVTKNPWNPEHVPGGSSGGSAAAVAANLALFALGTDTGGSVRHPASFCGVVGLKPTYGLCSRWGLIAMTSSTDVPGILAKTAADASLVLSAMAGADELDSTTLPRELEAYQGEMNEIKIKGLKIGIVEEFMTDAVAEPVKAGIRQTIELLEKAGATVSAAKLPYAGYGVSVYYVITPSEISSNLARFDGLRFGYRAEGNADLAADYRINRGQGFGDEVKRRIMLGTYALSAGYHDQYYLKAQQVRTLIARDFAKAFSSFDLLLCPSTPGTAFRIGEQIGDPLKMYLEDIFLTPASLAGLPAVSIPSGLADGLPTALQLIGPKLSEALLLAVGQELMDGLVAGRLDKE